MNTPTAAFDRRRGQSGFRQANVKRVIEALRLGPSSQAALARSTSLSASTVNVIVRSLRDRGLVETSSTNGRESLVALVPKHKVVIAVQVGASALRVAVFDFTNERRTDVSEAVVAESDAGPKRASQLIGEALLEAGIDANEVDVVSVAVQGPIARRSGSVASWAAAHLPGWQEVAIASELEAALGATVIVDNDANLAGLAEWTWGAGRGHDSFFYALCSAHIGGAFILAGKVYRGADGLAGEIGHMVVDPSGPLCFCGSRGCLTTYASEAALLASLASVNTDMLSLGDIIEGARSGDLAARGAFYEAGRLIGRALGNVGKTMAPEVIAVGGDLRAAGEPLIQGVRSAAEIASLRAVSPTIELRPAELVDDVVLLGALAAGLEQQETLLGELPEWVNLRTSYEQEMV
ncbi:ROK family transcriptional regulator [Leifsonia shinshuensis]|uniref:Putative NBD/HSP70 family sugar kinase n=1 Tax=Leifsonia shinshuensis TaxID=150026 RepID=A0A853D2E3_9MICO|nr:ROK family transcriptional regulator [Leifsonia shinshuensis]NYJ25611.1 putative NBD/HSP70 family sugar kinase [Leifsonia shinshuensis]